MTANEQDPDVIKWGLNLLDFGSLFNSSYGCDYNHKDGNTYHGQYMREYNYNADCNSDCNYVENDAMIAHTLQEEFSQLAVGDAAQSSRVEGDQFHSSNVSSDWQAPASPNCCPAHRDAYEDTNDTGHSSSCSSPGERPYDGEDYSYCLELTDESTFDGELGKRLDQMVPVPHVPKINGEIPSMDEATSDHQRLLDRLQLYELVERKVQGDGNCQFRSLSDQLYRTPEHHKFVRQQVVNQLKSHPEFYEGYVPMEYGEYLKKMSKSGEWGDHVTLQAAADSYGVKIFLITSFKDTCYMEIIPKVQKSKRGELLRNLGTSSVSPARAVHICKIAGLFTYAKLQCLSALSPFIVLHFSYLPKLLGRSALQLTLSTRRKRRRRIEDPMKKKRMPNLCCLSYERSLKQM